VQRICLGDILLIKGKIQSVTWAEFITGYENRRPFWKKFDFKKLHAKNVEIDWLPFPKDFLLENFPPSSSEANI